MLRRLFGRTLLVATLVAAPLGATWSIVAVNLATGEVAVASATCIPGDDIRAAVPILVVGRGAGAAQYAVDPLARNRRIMFDGFSNGETPRMIFDEIRANGPGSLQLRQFGIVGLNGPPLTFTGNFADPGREEVVGQSGDWIWAIQGNSLSGPEVIFAAQEAFRSTDGTMAERLLAGMQAARALGGDGRCSCDAFAPDSCGVPPPGFTKSAHVAQLAVARRGDTDGDCTPAGCLTGTYYLNLNVIGGGGSPDPILSLADGVASWRAGLLGRPDHLTSRAVFAAELLPADGLRATELVIALADLEGTPLVTGGARVDVAVHPEDDAELVSLGTVVDRGDGTYAVEVRAGTRPGAVRFVVTADDGVARATLAPWPILRLAPPTPLFLGTEAVSALAGSKLPFTLAEDDAAGAAYILLASGSGTEPGRTLGTHHVPLNFDALTLRSVERAGVGAFFGSIGRLDASGRAQPELHIPPGALVNWPGRIEWAAVSFGGALGASARVAGPVGFDVTH